jgi:hypothetical protein
LVENRNAAIGCFRSIQYRRSGGWARIAWPEIGKRAALAGNLVDMTGEFVLEPELFLLELMEKIFVRMGPMLLFVDHRMERRMLGCERIGLYLVHRCQFLS